MKQTQPVALVTGAARRVGRAIVEKLAGEGFDIALTYLSSADEAAGLASAIESRGRRAVAIRADLTHPDEAAETIHREFAAAYDRLDLLVNNASIYRPGDLRSVDPALMRLMYAIHAEAPLLLCQRFEPMLRDHEGGCVVNMVDILAERPWPQYLAYCASKAALLNLTLALARELAPDVRVNGIAPGVVEWAEGSTPDERRKYLQRVPLNRPGSPEDVAGLVHFLATGGRYITGQIIRLDGGRSIT